MYCWQADEEHPETLSIPVLIPSLSRRQITDIACGTSHCIAFSSITSKAYSWGTNYCGELGIGSVNPVNEPTEIVMPNDDKLTQVSCGNAFTIGISLPLKSVQSGSGTFIPTSEILQQISRGCALDSVQFDSGDVSTIQQTDSTMDAVLLTSFQPTPLKTDMNQPTISTTQPALTSTTLLTTNTLSNIPPTTTIHSYSTDTMQSSSTDTLYTTTIVSRQDRFTFDICSSGVCFYTYGTRI